MESIREIYKIGNGPLKAASIFKGRNPAADSYHVTLYGSLAAAGIGLNNAAIRRFVSSPKCQPKQTLH